MSNKFKILALAGLFAALPPAASATTIDFESFAPGTYSSLSTADFTITYTGGTGTFDVVSASPGAPIVDHALISFFKNPGSAPFKVAFSTPVSSFSIGVGDFNADEDNTFLEAYSASSTLLDSDTYVNPASMFGGGFLLATSSTVTPISYVLFWDAEPFPGAVLWDNMSYEKVTTEVPEPASLALLGLGLAGLGFARRRRGA